MPCGTPRKVVKMRLVLRSRSDRSPSFAIAIASPIGGAGLVARFVYIRDCMFVAIYRWRLKDDGVEAFREGWRRMTDAIYRTRGSLGSRLHRADDGTWVAIAHWPSRADWERSGAMEPA